MCKERLDSNPCSNCRCPHNLFWEGLELDMQRIHMTRKALQIRNCCRLIREPWTSDEIAAAWGLTTKGIRQCEGSAWRKVQRKRYVKESSQTIPTANNRVSMGRKGMYSRKHIPSAKQPLLDALRVE